MRFAELRALIREETGRHSIPLLELALVGEHGLLLHIRFADGHEQPVDPASQPFVFRAGSLSKMLNAVAIMRSVEAGRLDLDAPIAGACPELAFNDPFASGNPVTLRHLLSHTAGLVREAPVGSYYDAGEPTMERCVRSMIGSTLVHPPGTRAKYSNIGPTIAAWVAERATGVPWLELVEGGVLAPLGMAHSSFSVRGRPEPGLPTEAFMTASDGSRFTAPRFELGTVPSGNLSTTIADLAAFMGCLLASGAADRCRILRAETLDEMYRVPGLPAGAPGFGLGFVVSTRDGCRQVGHGGAVYGYSADFAAIPDDRVGVIVVNNLDCTGGVNANIRAGALACLRTGGLAKSRRHRPAAEPAAEPAGAEPRCGLAGTYGAGDAAVEVEDAEGGLVLRHLGTRNLLRPTGGDRYVTDDRLSWGVEVEFERDVRGGGAAVTIAGTRYPRAPAAASPDAPRLEELRRFTGDFGPAYAGLRFRVRGGRLACRIEWFYEYDLARIDGLRFAFPDHGMFEGERLRFVEDDAGAVVAVDLSGIRFDRGGGAV